MIRLHNHELFNFNVKDPRQLRAPPHWDASIVVRARPTDHERCNRDHTQRLPSLMRQPCTQELKCLA
uniref:Uncharacterized protein n=1 Tax=Hyaloperonospora arabidopsidis (strain Emoy2) TaxID=559515 RepID=M4BT55_HYAAE